MEPPNPRPARLHVVPNTDPAPATKVQSPPKLQMVMVGQWTGREAKALRLAMRMSIRAFAQHLGVGVRTVASWEAGETACPRPEMQEVLDAALANVNDLIRARFAYQLFDEPPVAVATVRKL